MKYKYIQQPDEMSCGITCLAMICAHYGIDNVSLTVIRNFAKTDRDGNSIKSLCIAAEKLNLKALGIKCSKQALLEKKVKFPLIVHTSLNGLYNHYMVLYATNEKEVILGDPASEITTMKWEEFEKIWSNKAIALEPTEHFSETKKYRKDYSFLISLLKKFKKEILLTPVFTGIISGVSMISTWFYSYLIDSIIPDNRLKMLLVMTLGLIGIYLLTAQLNIMKQRFSIKFNKLLDKELIINIYERITHLPISFYAMRTTGDIQARYQDGDTLRATITNISFDLIINICYAIWAFILVIRINWQMVVFAIAFQELAYIVQKYFEKKLEKQAREELQKETELDAFVMASFEANETVKNYTAEELMVSKMKDKYEKYQKVKYKKDLDLEKQESSANLINDIGQTLMLAVLGVFVMGQSITVGKLVTAYMYVSYLFAPIMSIISMKQQLINISATLERLDDVYKTPTEEDTDKKKKKFDQDIEKIEINKIQFAYGFRKNIIEDISFEINKGESVGIVGESGCGKTTLIKLIMGFLDVNDGEIKINGNNINNYTKKSIRQKMAYVSQNDFWFQDTIFNNLIIGKKNATQKEIDEVLKKVKMYDYIKESPYGYQTMLEEDAINLSSGEKQRLSIAKALITKPQVLILDESTANLDAKTEKYVVEQLKKEKDKIKIIVAHRLSTLVYCNKIIVIKDGKIIEKGTPKELLQKKRGLFKQMWEIQSRGFDNEETNDENYIE